MDGCERMRELIAQLPDQLEQSWKASQGLRIAGADHVRRLVVCGMGGSAAAAEVLVGSLADPALEIVVHRGYDLPFAVTDRDLVVFSSYSGRTEETLACFDAVAARRPAGPALVMSSGGTLSERARAASIEILDVPGGLPPRASLGHGVGRLCGVVAALGRPGVEGQVQAAIARLREGVTRFGLDDLVHGRSAVIDPIADALAGRLPVVYAGARTSIAAARRLRAQLNENAKVLASTAELPELDHNEIVGWSLEAAYRDQTVVLALRDPLEHPRVRQRFDITREVIGERAPLWLELAAEDGPALARTMELVQAGDALSVALAQRTGVDPMPVRPIDVLKERLAG